MRPICGIFKAIGVVFCTLICAIFVSICPLQSTFASSREDDYDSFHASLMNMIRNFDDEEIFLKENEFCIESGQILVSEKAIEKYNLNKLDDCVYVASNTEQNVDLKENSGNFFAVDDLEEKNGQVVVETRINRLIVNSSSDVDCFGAVAMANYKDWHIFQYASYDETKYAYDKFSNSNINVSFDFFVSAEDPIEENVDEEVIADSASTHNSWAEEFVGYDAFASTTLAMHSQSDLPEIVVAVIDSGLYANHELFANRILSQYAKNFTKEGNENNFQDLYGHGTHVSGTIAEFTLPNVKILPLKALNREGKGYGSMTVDALNYVVKLKEQGVNIKVANMSIGIDLSGNDLLSGYSDLTLAVKSAKAAGVASVVAAGNEQRNTRYVSPASIDEAFTVSALTRTSNQLGGYSLNFDSSYSNFGPHVDFCAPGTLIKSAGLLFPNSYKTMSGTSMATPHVSAAVALVLSNPFYANLSIDELYNVLCENSIDLGDEGRDDYYGNGCINIADIGVEFIGEIDFSEKEKIQTKSISLELKYGNNQNSEIYYVFGEADNVDKNNGEIYKSPIEIFETTQITAVGYFKNYDKKVLQVSHVSTMTYYFNNYDLISSFELSVVDGGYEISRYFGQDLTILNVPTQYNNRNIVGVGAYAFENSNVQVLNLPKNLKYIGQSSFSGNLNLKEIHCQSSDVEVRAYAFNRCKNLNVFDVPNVTAVGSNAFAYCENLCSLDLMQANEIGSNALSGSGIKDLYLREGVVLAEQSDIVLDHVYGFEDVGSSALEDFAHQFKGDFVNMKLRILSNLNSTIIVRSGETANFGLNFAGYNVKYDIYLNGEIYLEQNHPPREFGDGLEKWLMIEISNLPKEENLVKIRLKDGFGNQIESREMKIEVVTDDKKTFALSQTGEHYSMSVQDEKGENVTDSQNFYKDSKYRVEIRAENGYVLTYVSAKQNGQPLEYVEFSEKYAIFELSNIDGDVEISVGSSRKEMLTMALEMENHAEVWINGQLCHGQSDVPRDSDVHVEIKPFEGFEVSRVLIDGQKLTEYEMKQGTIEFVIPNVTKESTIMLFFNEISYKVQVSLGKGGSLSTNGEMQEDIIYGETREYHINANDGYSIDAVTVNGKTVDVKDGNFVVNGQMGDCNIVVSFKKSETSIFESGSVGLVYFFIFLTLLFVFMVAKIVLSLIRKNQKKKNELKKYIQK